MVLQITLVLILCGGLFAFCVLCGLSMAKMGRETAVSLLDWAWVIFFYCVAAGGAFLAVWLAYVCIGKILGYIPPDA